MRLERAAKYDKLYIRVPFQVIRQVKGIGDDRDILFGFCQFIGKKRAGGAGFNDQCLSVLDGRGGPARDLLLVIIMERHPVIDISRVVRDSVSAFPFQHTAFSQVI